MERRVTTVGPHRDEVIISISDRDLRTRASQGEQRTVALGLRVAAYELLREEKGATPMLILDDVFSELDPGRSQRLVEKMPDGQIFVSTAREEEVPLVGTRWSVSDGVVRGPRGGFVRDLEKVGGFLDQVLRRLGLPDPLDLNRLVEEWADLAGEPWGTRSQPAGLANGELVVEVDDGSIATLLRYQQKTLIDRLESRLGAPLVTSVRDSGLSYSKKASDQGFCGPENLDLSPCAAILTPLSV